MKSFLSANAFLALPLLGFAPSLGGQYRGPESEALLSSSRPIKKGSSATTAFMAPTLADGLGSWEFWFEWNKDVLIRSRHAESQEVLGDQPIGLLGEDRIEAQTVYERIVPALEEAIRRNDEELVRICIHALGKTGESDAFAALEKALDRADLETRGLAAVALGQLEDRESLAKLVSTFLDPSAPPAVRSHAAMGLGMRWEPEAAAMLREFLGKHLRLGALGGESEDLMLAAVRALGLSRDAASAPFLMRKFVDLDAQGHSKARATLCAILSSLGRLGDASALELLTASLGAKDLEIRRAAALACGDLADGGAVKALAETLESDCDLQTRGFAAISLGRIGGVAARDALRREFGSRLHRSVKEYCAIALGLAADEDSVEALRALLRSKEIDTTRAAAAVALGFLGDRVSADALLDIVEDRSEPAKLRGYAALAAGLMRAEDAASRLLEQLRTTKERLEDLDRGLVLGLGLTRDVAVSQELLRIVADGKRGSTRGHAALALGLIRDRESVQPLLDLLSSRHGSEDRAFAGIALGALADRYNYPRVAELFFNTNYRVRNPLIERAAMYF